MNKPFAIAFFFCIISAIGQSTKPKSFIVYKEDFYTLDVKNNMPSVVLFSQERKYVGDKDNPFVNQNRIDYTDSFEEVSDIDAFTISSQNDKYKVRNIQTEDREIDGIFYHDMKYKYFYFPNLKDDSETYCSYKKTFKVPQLLDTYYFKDNIDCKDSKVTLKVSNTIEIGYTLQGDETNLIQFSTSKEGDFTLYTWQLLNSSKVDYVEEAPNPSYFLPHLIFYIKNYTVNSVKYEVLGSVDNLYKYYYKNIKDINKTDQSALKNYTEELIKGLNSDFDKTKAIFDYVQTKIHYVAFEDGMGGFIPRDAAEVFQKKYGDCKDMANLLNEMLHYANIESFISWIGTRHNNYTYEKVPTPIVDNHMITVAKIADQYFFLDATGQFSIFPGFTPFIQGKQALLKIDENNYKIIPVPVIAADENKTTGKIQYQFDGDVLKGEALFLLKGFSKMNFLGTYKHTIDQDNTLKLYLSQYIAGINTKDIVVKNDDLSQNPLEIKHAFDLEKWTKRVGNQIIFKPILFFPFSNERIDVEKRKIPLEFDFKKSFDYDYEIMIPENYTLEYSPDNYEFSNDLMSVKITYSHQNNKIVVSQHLKINTLLLERNHFSDWNTAIKGITKQYNQNIILTKS
jgi:hypothetical protein